MIRGDNIERTPYIERRKFRWKFMRISSYLKRPKVRKKSPYQKIITNVKPDFKLFRDNKWYTERLKRKKPLHKWIFDKGHKCSVCGIDDLDCYDKTCDEIIMQKALR